MIFIGISFIYTYMQMYELTIYNNRIKYGMYSKISTIIPFYN